MLAKHFIVISVKGLKTKYFLETIDIDTGGIEYNYQVKIFLNVLKARTARCRQGDQWRFLQLIYGPV